MAIDLIQLVKDTIFPLSCVRCQRDGILLCARCRADFVCRNNQHCPYCDHVTMFGAACKDCHDQELDGVVSLGWYANPTLQTLIRHWKYSYVREVEGVIERLLYVWLNDAQRVPTDDWTVVPMPLYPSRDRQRGFNQSEIFARMVAQELGLPLAAVLSRTRHTWKAQAELDNQKRSQRRLDVFRASAPVPRHVILVDDVYTTGKTMRSAAAELKRAGAEVVWGLVLARGD